MTDALRRLWRDRIAADDYERHMAAVGQAQANADLLAELFRERAPKTGARLLFAGSGPGQCFDYLPPATLARYRPTFTDINPVFLSRLAARLEGLDFSWAIDDIEAPRLAGPFDVAIVVLVLEHVDWRKAAAALARQAARLFLVIQENPPAVRVRELPGTLAALRDAPPALVDRDELIPELAGHGFVLKACSIRDVADGKKMVGLDLTRRP